MIINPNSSGISSYEAAEEAQGQGPPCAEKIAFDTERQAAAAANVAEYQHGAHVRPYRCQYCGLWHLASSVLRV